jgi:hypothetical protein
MCALCEKIKIVKDILKGYFTDEELEEMSKSIGLEGWNVKGTRLSLYLMAVVELCVEQGLDPLTIHDGVHVAIMRDALKRQYEEAYPDRDHTLKERLEGYES